MTSGSRWGRAAPGPLLIRTAWGLLLVIAPGRVLQAMGGVDESRTPRRIMRILGARHLVEAVAESSLGGSAREVGVWVDGLHAMTSLAFAWRNGRWRRAASTDAAVASGFAALGYFNK
jgi:hypothetical protein